MKKFIVSVLCVAVFFLGLGSLAERVGAKFKSDAKALELLAKARQAIGGDEAIKSIRSLSIKGKQNMTFKINGTDKTEQGDVEIAMQLPNQVFKTIKVGNADGNASHVIEEERNIVLVKKGEGEPMIVQGQTTDNGQKNVTVKVDTANGQDGKVIIKKSDGTTEEVKLEGNNDSQVINTQDGTKVIVKKVEGGNAVFKTTDANANGQNVIVNKDVRVVHGGGHENELFRLTLSLLLSSPEGTDVSYTFAGEETVGGIACNAINATLGEETIKLFLDKSSNLPVAMNYKAAKMPQMMMKVEKVAVGNGEKVRVQATSGEAGNKPKEVHTFERQMHAPEMADFQVRFSDFRGVNGVQFPFHWETSTVGKSDEVFEVSNIEVNPANIADKFKAQPMKMVKVVKAQ
jgi:hypothetical protein